MKKLSANPERLVERLWFYNYRYRLEGSTLIVYLPMICALKVVFNEGRLKITSHLRGRYFFDQIEYIFLFYCFMLVVAFAFVPNLNTPIYPILGFFFVYLIVCFIKTEIMKSIIHNWMETDSLVNF
ncbi:MAG: hypothetical protein ACHQD9_06755 [Chitinophagales bacterium]